MGITIAPLWCDEAIVIRLSGICKNDEIDKRDFSQVRIGHSIADFVMINGEGRVYEIKSDLDNFDRLYDQLRDYYRAFSKVSVLVSIHELEESQDE